MIYTLNHDRSVTLLYEFFNIKFMVAPPLQKTAKLIYILWQSFCARSDGIVLEWSNIYDGTNLHEHHFSSPLIIHTLRKQVSWATGSIQMINRYLWWIQINVTNDNSYLMRGSCVPLDIVCLSVSFVCFDFILHAPLPHSSWYTCSDPEENMSFFYNGTSIQGLAICPTIIFLSSIRPITGATLVWRKITWLVNWVNMVQCMRIHLGKIYQWLVNRKDIVLLVYTNFNISRSVKRSLVSNI